MKTIENYKFRDMILRIGKKAVKEAQTRSLANGCQMFSAVMEFLIFRCQMERLLQKYLKSMRVFITSLKTLYVKRSAILVILLSGVPPPDVAKDLGVSLATLYRWIPASEQIDLQIVPKKVQ